jgi:hypothetical protein
MASRNSIRLGLSDDVIMMPRWGDILRDSRHEIVAAELRRDAGRRFDDLQKLVRAAVTAASFKRGARPRGRQLPPRGTPNQAGVSYLP